MENKLNIFLVEDDKNFGSVLKSYLEINDFNVSWIKDSNSKTTAYVFLILCFQMWMVLVLRKK